MRIRIHRGSGSGAARQPRKSGTAHRHTHHAGTKTTGSKSMSAAQILSVLESDPAAFSQLVQDIASALFSSGFSAEIIDAIEAITGTGIKAGTLLAGTVSTLAGALQLNGSSQPVIAMVFLNGAATASACYVPTHIRASLATGQDVFVEPINGNLNDLQIFSIRNVF